MTRNKKGQMSIEILLILGVLVIGGIIFGTYYLSSVRPKTTADFDIDDRIFNDKINTIEYTDDFEDPEEPPEPPVNQFSNLVLTLDPNSSSYTNTSFGINASVREVVGYNSGKITKVEIKKKNEILNVWEDSSDCSFNGNYNSSFTDLNLLYLNGTYLENTVNFSCNSTGEYEFEFYASPEPNTENITLIRPINKIIISSGNCVNFSGNITFNKISGEYNNDFDLYLDYINDLNCVGDLYYTLDGSEPTETSNKYENPIFLNGNLLPQNNIIVKAKVFGINSSGSPIYTTTQSQTYVFKTVNPVANPGAGTYNNTQTVLLSSSTNESKITYTIDDSEPKITSSEYIDPITISTNTTLKARAFKENYMSSDIITNNYIITP